MTASRNNRLPVRWAFVAAFGGLSVPIMAFGADAPVGPPQRLGPPPATKPSPQPTPAPSYGLPPGSNLLVPPPGATPAPAATAPTPGTAPVQAQPQSQPQAQPTTPSPSASPERAPVKKGITANELAPLSPDGFGVLRPSDRPFPDTLWQGTGRQFAQQLLPKIGATASPALQDLALRLLAGGGALPEGDGPPGLFIASRAERLSNALGRPDLALALLQALPGIETEDGTRLTTDLAFLAGNYGAGCTTIRQKRFSGPYWDQATVVCSALDGQASAAQLGLDLLRENKVKDDGFAVLVERALGAGDVKLGDQIPTPQTLSLALFDKAREAIPRKALETAKAPVLRTIAEGSGFPADQRLVATERAVALGALPPGKLAEAYLALPLTQDDRDQPINRAEAAGGAKGRAILFNAARAATNPTAKGNLLATLFAKTPRADLYPAIVRAADMLLLETPVTVDLKGAAIELARASFALDRYGQGLAWMELAGPDGAVLGPLAHIAGRAAPAAPWSATPLVDLLAQGRKEKDAPAQALRRAVFAGQLLAALGTPLPDALLLPLQDAKVNLPSAAGPGLLIESAVGQRRLGGTVLAILAGLGEDGVTGNAALIAQSVAALRTVGLGEEARRLALDAAIAAGL